MGTVLNVNLYASSSKQITQKKFKFAITLGDPTGISSEVLLKGIYKLPKGIYILYGSKKILEKTAKLLNIKNPFKEIKQPEEAYKNGFYLLNLVDRDFELGKPSVLSGEASVIYLEKAVDDILKNKVDVLITLPISKEYIIKSGFKYKGHTDYLAYKAGIKDYIMLLGCEKLKVALATTHIPLREVPNQITRNMLKSKLILLQRELKNKFKIENPKIAVLGLNPHASDNGQIGDEEIKVINPTIELLRKEGLNLIGSLSPDTAFNNYKKFDCYFAMYHDQGLIPLKLLCFKKAVNITLGLPFIRTSVDHGTGFDIAGKGIADPSSFIEAVKWANDLTSWLINYRFSLILVNFKQRFKNFTLNNSF